MAPLPLDDGVGLGKLSQLLPYPSLYAGPSLVNRICVETCLAYVGPLLAVQVGCATTDRR